uniref:Uncharacterized protein n=1 Tax=Romanomermis culicivorax TaxID=13658 RepID=A0A915JVP8_ROMCU
MCSLLCKREFVFVDSLSNGYKQCRYDDYCEQNDQGETGVLRIKDRSEIADCRRLNPRNRRQSPIVTDYRKFSPTAADCRDKNPRIFYF